MSLKPFLLLLVLACLLPAVPARCPAETPVVIEPQPASSEPAQNAEGRFKDSLKHYAAGEYEKAAQSALETADRYPDTPWEGRSLFLAARSYAAENDLAAASSVFGHARRKYPLLADYSVYILARSYLKAARYDEAASTFLSLVSDYPDSPLVPDCLLRAGGAYVELGRYTYAIGCLKRLMDAPRSSRRTAEARYFLMKSYAGIDNYGAAREQYRDLWHNHPDDPSTDKAEGLAAGLAASGVAMPKPGYDDFLQRADRLFDHGLYRAALRDYMNALALLPKDSARTGDTLLKLGQCHYRLRENTMAVTFLKSVVDRHSREAPEALYWLTRTYLRMEDAAGIRESARSCASRHPDSPWADDCLYLLGMSFDSDGDYDNAVDTFKRILDKYPGSEKTAEVLWRVGWAYFSKGDYRAAEGVFDRLVKAYPDSELAPQGLYWRAKSLDALKRPDEAKGVYARLTRQYGLSYYGLSAGVPAGLYARDDTYAPWPPSTPGPAAAGYTDGALARAVELGIQGMRPEGVRELMGAEGRYRAGLERVKVISGVYGLLGEYRRPLELVSGLYGETIRTGRGMPPADAMTMIFPLPYWDVISREAGAFEVDPFIVYALIREESRFDPDAVSGAGAVGLMQLMPDTARMMCRRLNVSYGSAGNLKEEGFNVPLGVCYLKSLLKRHGGRLAYALAEYNAGPDALARWVKMRPDAPDDEFIEDIGYHETRNYVKRVLRNYKVYGLLYGVGRRERGHPGAGITIQP